MLNSSSKSEQLASRLFNKSQISPTSYENSINWCLGVNLHNIPKNLDHLWIKGLDIEKELTESQILEIAWLEVARDISMFIWFEQKLVPIYIKMASNKCDNMSEIIKDYITIFAKEEIVHVLCFKKFMNIAGLKYFPPPSSYADVFNQLHELHPIMAILITLLTEWVAENVAMYSTQENYVDPLTKQLFDVHHSDEIRHIAFGRALAEDYFTQAPFDEKSKILAVTKNMLSGLLNQFTYNREIARLVSFAYPRLPYENQEIVINSENNKRINRERFNDILLWVKKLDRIVYSHC